MAIKSNKNFLNFTKLTYSEIQEQVNNRLASDPKFTNFRESSIAKIMTEIFTASDDMTNYYLERRSEENYFDTAQLKSSVILLAKQLGYVVTRPIPAKSALSMTIKGPLPSGLVPNQDKVSIVKYDSQFTHGGYNYIATNTYTYTLTDLDIANGVGNADFEKVIDASVISTNGLQLDEDGNVPTSATKPIEIMQGDIVTTEFLGTAPNAPIGETFQTYVIDDKKFSNLYGEQDLGYDKKTSTYNLSQDVTKIGIGNNVSAAFQEENLFEIDRRSLLTSQTVLDSTSVSANVPRVVAVKTTMEEGIEVIFGDGILAQKGPQTTVDNLFVQFLSTEGMKANSIGVITEKLSPKSAYRTSYSNIDLTSNITFKLTKNITGGADLEDIDSIKINAPELFYSLDRIVTKGDYTTYLKSLTSPLNVKNAIAWGEQDEIQEGYVNTNPNSPAIKKLFNIALYSVAGSVYDFPPGGEASSKDLSASSDQATTYLEGTDLSLFNGQTLFNLYVTGVSADCNNGGDAGIVEEIGKVQKLPSDHPVSIVNDQLDNRAQITVRHIYASPIVQEFALTGDIFVQSLTSLSDTKLKVNNAVYTFLNEQADFNVPVYASNLVQIIEEFPEILNANVKLEPLNSFGASINGSITSEPELSGYSPTDQAIIADQFNSAIATYVAGDNANITVPSLSGSSSFDINEYEQTVLPEATWTKSGGWETDSKGHFRFKGIDERTFYFDLFRKIWNNLNPTNPAITNTIGSFRNSDNFKSLMFKYNNSLKVSIRNGMLDSNGNVTNYSLRNELPQINIKANYKYRV